MGDRRLKQQAIDSQSSSTPCTINPLVAMYALLPKFTVTITLLLSVVCCASAVEPSVKSSTWAVVPTSSATDGLADLLTAELTEIEGLSLVERAEIGRVLKEQEIGASGLADPAHLVLAVGSCPRAAKSRLRSYE
jgi:hypothetical protein